jgi:hypothetical protein
LRQSYTLKQVTIMAKRKASTRAKGSGSTATKASVKNRTVNQPDSTKKAGEPFTNQDVKRRLGNFEGAGEPSRQGTRQGGLIGQTKRKFRTDKKKK